MKLNCIAIDDEPLALDKIEAYVKKVPFLNLIASFDNAIDSIEFIKANKVDLMFLDIQMDEFTGIQLLETLTEKPKVILTTAYDSYALKGYELDVADYLLKPISFDRFMQAVNKVFDSFGKESGNGAKVNKTVSAEDKKEDFIFIKTEYRMQKVVFSEILYIEGMKDYLRIITPDAKIMTLQSFNKMEEMLPKEDFMRIHKSFIIAIDKIKSIERRGVKIADQMIPIGETYKKQFFDILKQRGLI